MWQETNKQWDLKVLVSWSTAFNPEGLEVERHFPKQPTASFLYPFLGPPAALAATTEEHRNVCVLYLHEAWQLSSFLIMIYVFLKGSKDVCVLILMLSPAPLVWLGQLLCFHHFTDFYCSSAPCATVLELGRLGAASQFPAETRTTWVMQEFFVSLDLAPRKRAVESCSALRGCAWRGSQHRDGLMLLSP